MAQSLQRVYPDANRLEAWGISRNIGQTRIRKSELNRFIKKHKSSKVPKRLSSPWEIFRYFVNCCSWHGVYYWFDESLHKVERVTWLLLDLICLISSLYIISNFYTYFHETSMKVSIEDLQYSMKNIPFPGVVICPDSRIDYQKIPGALEKHVSFADEAMKMEVENLLHKMGNMRFTDFSSVNSNIEQEKMYFLEHVNITQLLIDVMPDCENIFSDCKWNHAEKNCCNIFEVRKTYYGFCYGLKISHEFRTYSSEPESGLIVTLKSLTNGKDRAVAMVDDFQLYPTKGSLFSFGNKFEIGVRVLAAFSSDEVLALCEYPDSPCKYENGNYRTASCLDSCVERHVIDKLKCNPIFFFPYKDGVPSCTIDDFKNLELLSANIKDAYDIIHTQKSSNNITPCDCAKACKSFDYDSFVRSVPFHDNEIGFDIHFYSRTSIRYKQDIPVSALQMLVQFGGIFGLFMGGSIISFIESFYMLATLFFYFIWRKYRYFTGKDEIDTQRLMIYVISHPKTIYPYAN